MSDECAASPSASSTFSLDAAVTLLLACVDTIRSAHCRVGVASFSPGKSNDWQLDVGPT
jgi:hypothetical protein